MYLHCIQIYGIMDTSIWSEDCAKYLHHTGPKRALSNIKSDVADIICNVDDLICDVDNIICDVDKYFVTKFFDVYEWLY